MVRHSHHAMNPRKVHTENICDTGSPSDRGQETDCGVAKQFHPVSSYGREDILGRNPSFSQRVLRSWGVGLSSLRVRHEGTVTQSPDTRPFPNFQVPVHEDPASLFGAR